MKSYAREENVLVANGLSKTYGAFEAVRKVDLEVRRSEFVSILGASGCGKTTLLRMLAGLETPSEGTVHIDGKDYTGISANRRPTNMVFQSYALFPHLSVAENIAYGLYGKGLSRHDMSSQARRMLELVQLVGYEQRMPHQLSGGQRQRVGLARALACQPKVLLLDEPLSALDKNLREAMQTELRGIQKEIGISFVLVTHDQEEAFSLSDRIVVMSEGRVLQYADALDLYERPVSLEVAQFVGDINLFEGGISSETDKHWLVNVAGIGLLAASKSGAASVGQSVVLGVRPEKITIGKTPFNEDAGQNRIKAQFLRAAFKGDRYRVLLRAGEGAREVEVFVQNRDLSFLGMTSGQDVFLSWRKADTILIEK